MKCNLCGSEKFIDVASRKKAACKICGSLERTRLLWLFINKYELNLNTKILHIAPEKGLYFQLSKITSETNYITADIFPDNFKKVDKNCRKIDLCSLDDEFSDHYDFIIHSHVMEHTPCNIAYTLFHLHRMLKTSGRHICIIPFMSGKYDESFQDLSNEDRTKRFGQYDHVRRFGESDTERHLGSIIKLPKYFDATESFPKDLLIESNIPKNHWKGFHPGTILDLRKTDYKLR